MKDGNKNRIKNIIYICGVVIVVILFVLNTMNMPQDSDETAGNPIQAVGNDSAANQSEAPDEDAANQPDASDENAASQSEASDENAASQPEASVESLDSAFEDLSETTSEVPESVDAILEGAQSAEWADVPPEQIYSFRNERLSNQHYEKHGIEMGFDTIEEYVAAANAVINHPDVLHKQEAEDNDDVYFLEATSEFVVVSTDGYIRTYFIASGGIDYYNRQ